MAGESCAWENEEGKAGSTTLRPGKWDMGRTTSRRVRAYILLLTYIRASEGGCVTEPNLCRANIIMSRRNASARCGYFLRYCRQATLDWLSSLPKCNFGGIGENACTMQTGCRTSREAGGSAYYSPALFCLPPPFAAAAAICR